VRRLILLAAALALAGCATTEMVWKKPGASEQDLKTDTDGCRSQAYAAQGMTSDPQRLMIVYTNCMEGKGWRREEAQKQ
jgi:hypothetical protein